MGGISTEEKHVESKDQIEIEKCVRLLSVGVPTKRTGHSRLSPVLFPSVSYSKYKKHPLIAMQTIPNLGTPYCSPVRV